MANIDRGSEDHAILREHFRQAEHSYYSALSDLEKATEAFVAATKNKRALLRALDRLSSGGSYTEYAASTVEPKR